MAENCCGETVEYNPKMNNVRNRRSASTRFTTAKNPIEPQVEDEEELRRLFQDSKNTYVPYSGTAAKSSHSLQLVLGSMPDLSSTLGATLERIKSFSLGGKIDIVRRVDPVFNLEIDTEVGADKKLLYYEFLKEYIRFYGADGNEIDLRTFGEYAFESLNKTGDAFIEIAHTDTLGIRSVSVHIYKPGHCLYLYTPKGKQRFIAISPKWDVSYIQQYPPQILPVHPTYRGREKNRRSMMHLKIGNNIWYGRPKWISSFQDAFLEFLNADYKLKETGTRFVGTGIVEVEDNNPEATGTLDDQAQEDGFDSFADQLTDNFTAQGENPMPFLFMTRGYGSKPAFVYQFQSNTNEKWFESTGQDIRKSILLSNQWTERLIGESKAGGFSNDVFLSEFKVMGMPTVKTWQNKLDSAVNTILSDALDFLGNTEFKELSTKYTSPFAGDLERMANAEEQTQDNGDDPDNSVGGN